MTTAYMRVPGSGTLSRARAAALSLVFAVLASLQLLALPTARGAALDTLTDTITAATRAHPMRYAFFGNWDDQSLTLLEGHLDAIDVLVPVWLHLDSREGDIKLDDPDLQKEVVELVKSHGQGVRITPLINNYVDNAWDPAMAVAVLRDRKARLNLVDKIASYVRDNGFAGINVDFEALPPSALGHLEAFVGELRGALRSENATVSVTLPLFDSVWTAAQFVPFADTVILMGYDEHSAFTEPGPISSREWFENGVEQSFDGVDPSKIVLAIGNYGYDWKAGGGDAEVLTFNNAIQIARVNNAKTAFDSASGNTTFSYTAVDGSSHKVWYLDGVSAFNQVRTTAARTPQGYALWRTGAEDPSVWEIFRKLANPASLTADTVREVDLGKRVSYHGTGEIVRLDGSPTKGVRNLETDPESGIIVSASFEIFPKAYEIFRMGHRAGKFVALTFDDGPDPQSTAKVLDILARNGVLATFFVVGQNVKQHPQLLSQIARGGHEIGNHTWSHPSLLTVAEQDVRTEIEQTDKLINALTGRSTTLFRPPYADGLNARSEDDLVVLRVAAELGLDTVGMGIDSQDWIGPGVDKIVRRVVDGALNGKGNIVVLHDSSDNSDQTVAALPKIIAALRKEGFSFTTVSNLLDEARAARGTAER